MKDLPFSKEKTVCLVGPCQQTAELNQFTKDQLIFIDGGAKYRDKNQQCFTIGDNDSLNEKEVAFDILFNPKKDFSDLKGALSLLTSKQEKIFLSGFSGGRLDHFLCVLGDCFNHLDENPGSIIFLDDNVTLFPKGTHQIEFVGDFSLISFKENKVSLVGNIAYPCKDLVTYPGSSQLLSNHSQGIFTLTNQNPAALIKGNYCVD